jgi:hypothetical protein
MNVSRPMSEGPTFRRSKEYSLDELLEHPMLSVQMTNGGIERRCVDLMLEVEIDRRGLSEGEYCRAWVDYL